jgi:hypothetical protein
LAVLNDSGYRGSVIGASFFAVDYSSVLTTVSTTGSLVGSFSSDFFLGAELGAQAPAIHVEIPNFGRIQACNANQAMMKAIKIQSSFILVLFIKDWSVGRRQIGRKVAACLAHLLSN